MISAGIGVNAKYAITLIVTIESNSLHGIENIANSLGLTFRNLDNANLLGAFDGRLAIAKVSGEPMLAIISRNR
jgi:hypothetical protein